MMPLKTVRSWLYQIYLARSIYKELGQFEVMKSGVEEQIGYDQLRSQFYW